MKEVRRLVGFSRAIVQPLYSSLAIKRSKANFFESQYLKHLAQERYNNIINNASVYYIGIDIPSKLPSRKSNKPSIITITSGGMHKRNDLVIELHRRLRSSGLDISLIIVGNNDAIKSSLSNEDNHYIESENSVESAGYLSREELWRRRYFFVLRG